MPDSPLILPGDPLFEETLLRPPPDWRDQIRGADNYAFIVRADSMLLEPVNISQLDDYMEGGEYDERLGAIGEDADTL